MLTEQQEHVKVALDGILAQSEEHLAKAKANLQEIESAMGKAHEFREEAATVLAAVGVETHHNHFARRVKEYDEASRRWLWASGLLAVISSIGALGFLLLIPDKPTHDLQYLVSKFVFLSVLLSATAFAAKNYLAARQNSVVNQHRMTALKTFRSFFATSEDHNVRDAVLVETTRMIYGAQSTGYSKGGDVPNTTLIEVAKSLGIGGKD